MPPASNLHTSNTNIVLSTTLQRCCTYTGHTGSFHGCAPHNPTTKRNALPVCWDHYNCSALVQIIRSKRSASDVLPAILPAVVHHNALAKVEHGSPLGGNESVWVLFGGQRTAQQLLVGVRTVQVCWRVS